MLQTIPHRPRHATPLAAALIVLCCLFAPTLTASEPAPAEASTSTATTPLRLISSDQLELHGTLYGQPFWARLLTAEQRYGGHRVMQLVYVPPKPDDLGGTHLVDHPFLLINSDGRIIAWNERSEGLSGAEFRSQRAQPGYAIALERSVLNDGQPAPVQITRDLASAQPAWSTHLAPLFLALTWQANAGQQRIPTATLFGADEDIRLHHVTVDSNQVIFPGELTGRIEADSQGRLARIIDSDGNPILSVSAWLSDPQEPKD